MRDVKEKGVFVHYVGWNAGYDAWLPVSDLKHAKQDLKHAKQKVCVIIVVLSKEINVFMLFGFAVINTFSTHQTSFD